jgi:A/G-specific adenine glycosylase
MVNKLFAPAEMSSRLLAWYSRCGRDLPWRKTQDPYRIWLSEIMLQQTGVSTVIPYYERFLAHFPTVLDLAAAPVDRVIELWAGLGYYCRSRNLHAAAQMVAKKYGGEFPAELEELMHLPGVGRSTAGAILSIAFNRKAPILDGNVRRVLCRLYALAEESRSTKADRLLWRWAEDLTPDDMPRNYAQAIMDLGAVVCTPSRPDCRPCPLKDLCQARKLGVEKELPVRRKKKKVPVVTRVALLLIRQGHYLVQKRPLDGMLGGLWEFPGCRVREGQDPAKAAEVLLRALGLKGKLHDVGRVNHAYSHFRLDLRLYQGAVSRNIPMVEKRVHRWLVGSGLADLPLHGAHKKILPLLASEN